MTEISGDIGIVGAGLAGLTCARRLRREGFAVTLFDKSRGVGGRLATRRLSVGDREIRVDHGLPFLTVRGERSAALCRELASEGAIRPDEDGTYRSPDGINSLAKFLARGLDIRREFPVTRLIPGEDRWTVEDNSGAAVGVRALVVAIPAPQALALFRSSALPLFLPEFSSIEYDPCFTVIAGYPDPQPVPTPGTDFRHVGHDDERKVFVLQCGSELARLYLDSEDLEEVRRRLLARSGLPSPSWSQVHRWRFALPRRALETACLSSVAPLPLVCCGDWCAGGDSQHAVEAALISAETAAHQVRHLLTLTRSAPGSTGL